MDSTNVAPDPILLLYDEVGHVLDLTATVAPITPESVRNELVWKGLAAEDAIACQAAIMRCMSTGVPQTIQVTVNPLGLWRTTIFRCRVGKARMVAITRPVPPLVLSLTPRQREICKLLGSGLSSREIAARLDLARETVDNHRALIAKRIKIKPHSLLAWCGANLEWF